MSVAIKNEGSQEKPAGAASERGAAAARGSAGAAGSARAGAAAEVSRGQHTSAYVSILTYAAYVSIRQHTDEVREQAQQQRSAEVSIPQHTSAY